MDKFTCTECGHHGEIEPGTRQTRCPSCGKTLYLVPAPWINWECPDCGETHSDPVGIETHCRRCGLVVTAVEGVALGQGRHVPVTPREKRKALDGETCPVCGHGFLEAIVKGSITVYVHQYNASGRPLETCQQTTP